MGAFVAPAVIVLAHNAAFDRGFAERLPPYFATKAWGCAMSEPPWREEGFEGLQLAYLAAQSGVFYDRHRALADCHATLHLLGRPLPASGRSALAHLLERARRPSFRLWAEGAPFEHKDTLKDRGYRWSGGEGGRPAPGGSTWPTTPLDGELPSCASTCSATRWIRCSGGSAPIIGTPSGCKRRASPEIEQVPAPGASSIPGQDPGLRWDRAAVGPCLRPDGADGRAQV